MVDASSGAGSAHMLGAGEGRKRWQRRRGRGGTWNQRSGDRCPCVRFRQYGNQTTVLPCRCSVRGLRGRPTSSCTPRAPAGFRYCLKSLLSAFVLSSSPAENPVMPRAMTRRGLRGCHCCCGGGDADVDHVGSLRTPAAVLSHFPVHGRRSNVLQASRIPQEYFATPAAATPRRLAPRSLCAAPPRAPLNLTTLLPPTTIVLHERERIVSTFLPRGACACACVVVRRRAATRGSDDDLAR